MTRSTPVKQTLAQFLSDLNESGVGASSFDDVKLGSIEGVRFDADAWYGQTAVAEALGWSPRSLERWRSKNVGPPFYRAPVGGRVFYRGADLNDWLAEGREPTGEERRRRQQSRKADR